MMTTVSTKKRFTPFIYAKLGQSGSIFGLSLLEQKEIFPIKVVAADMSYPAGIDRFKKSYPDSFYNVGIAEQNLIGVCSGLASEGFKSVAVAQAVFISMRSFEQVRQYLGYMHSDVVLVGISAGFALTFLGSTHYALEDLNLMRGIPDMIVLSPSDSSQAIKAFEAAMNTDKPVYIRTTGGINNPIVYKEDYKYEIGKSLLLSKGKELVIIATGSMVYQAIESGKILTEKYNIIPTIIDMHTIKPIDKERLETLNDYKLIITIEEHFIIGGLGTSIAEYMAENSSKSRLLRLGVKDKFSPVGDYQFLLETHRLIPEYIAEDIVIEFNKL
jgi:transketolase